MGQEGGAAREGRRASSEPARIPLVPSISVPASPASNCQDHLLNLSPKGETGGGEVY